MQSTQSSLKTVVARRKSGKSVFAFWTRDLPRRWRAMAVAPLDLAIHRDYEADAVRAIGTDEDGLPCFTAHRFVLGETRSDDDDDFYTEVAYAESLSAWRLRDGRWLILRVVVRDGEIERGRAFYSFGESMPR